MTQPVPDVGDDETAYAAVDKFYDFWFSFKSWREFPHADEEDVEQAESREEKRCAFGPFPHLSASKNFTAALIGFCCMTGTKCMIGIQETALVTAQNQMFVSVRAQSCVGQNDHAIVMQSAYLSWHVLPTLTVVANTLLITTCFKYAEISPFSHASNACSLAGSVVSVLLSSSAGRVFVFCTGGSRGTTTSCGSRPRKRRRAV